MGRKGEGGRGWGRKSVCSSEGLGFPPRSLRVRERWG